ncbi:MAG: M20/M25/M40 family metallo-hydrolase [Nitrospirae bacterium]|nr:M20/M25/M40 family metallo-hydrolase [Nitrospirota bacterium]
MRHTLFPQLLLLLFFAVQPAIGDEDLTTTYREDAGRIIGAALTDEEGWEKLTYLTTVVGARLSGSEQLEQAIAWATETLQDEGFDNVSNQPVDVTHWVRGQESARVVAPIHRDLAILGLGRSVGTPVEGIEAPAVVVASFDELEALGRAAVEGKIVVYAVPWEGYGKTVRYRGDGASRAAALGAVAVLVRSATGRSIASPHTGALRYSDDAPRIPAAAITVEDAEWMQRLVDMGHDLRLALSMDATTLPDAESANVVAEIRGSQYPEEVVVMGGHFDSWDVGQGAHDDGAGCIAAWQALRILQRLGLQPRRTLRLVLWTNEENGLAGGKAYREWVGEGIDTHVAAIEMDGGAERPLGFGFGLNGVEPDSGDPTYESALEQLQAVGNLLTGIEAGQIFRGGGGADIGPLVKSGVPGLGLKTVGEHYFDWHHTEADTLDKIDPQDFRRAVAMLAVMGYVLADMPGRLVSADSYGPLAAASP